ncbi:hypothetical protein [Acidithiobacillus ferrooxidans]|uniref:hypothetical protein n=1 Tax=Acidithiobacillus ferrooxidans TaxID=920 RepID=UPI000AA78A7F|nr:hypothetical protein [Acidithiobacillus ferrooxidans]
MNLILPVEVRGEADLPPLRDVVLDALRGNTALSSFPDYGFQDWMNEQDRMRHTDLHAHQVLAS